MSVTCGIDRRLDNRTGLHLSRVQVKDPEEISRTIRESGVSRRKCRNICPRQYSITNPNRKELQHQDIAAFPYEPGFCNELLAWKTPEASCLYGGGIAFYHTLDEQGNGSAITTCSRLFCRKSARVLLAPELTDLHLRAAALWEKKRRAGASVVPLHGSTELRGSSRCFREHHGGTHAGETACPSSTVNCSGCRKRSERHPMLMLNGAQIASSSGITNVSWPPRCPPP